MLYVLNLDSIDHFDHLAGVLIVDSRKKCEISSLFALNACVQDAGQGHILTANGGQLAWALASVILLDTNAMNKQTNVVGPIDQVQCPSLCSAAGIVDPKSHYRLVLDLRSCMTGFSVTDKLRKDYKEWMLPFPNQNSSGTEPGSLLYGIATIVSKFYDHKHDN